MLRALGVETDDIGRVICHKYHAKIQSKTCVLRQKRIWLVAKNSGKVIGYIDDEGCQNCEIGAYLESIGKQSG